MWKYKCGSLYNVKYNISLYLLISEKMTIYLSTIQFERQAFRCVILTALKGSIRRSYPQVCVCVWTGKAEGEWEGVLSNRFSWYNIRTI